MENLDAHLMDSHAKQLRIPVQLPLTWNDTPDESVLSKADSATANSADAIQDAARKIEQHDALIEAQAGRTKVVCLSLLGFILLALHFY